MSIAKKITRARNKRASRVRQKLSGSLPRVSVFRSLTHIYAQLINDNDHRTLVSCSSLELKNAGNKREQAHLVGKELARRALEKGIPSAALDRGSSRYHGRVKSLAEGLREGGLQI